MSVNVNLKDLKAIMTPNKARSRSKTPTRERSRSRSATRGKKRSKSVNGAFKRSPHARHMMVKSALVNYSHLLKRES